MIRHEAMGYDDNPARVLRGMVEGSPIGLSPEAEAWLDTMETWLEQPVEWKPTPLPCHECKRENGTHEPTCAWGMILNTTPVDTGRLKEEL